ncbi:glycine betaine/proline transport system substrate-binding protein [Duganella sp. 1224]|uniref:glycine betaine ABC transporter substrate-binding protein n=1 Tax=Duganella sp. 1224 TaxID=2587052 RepID=UPI0015CD0F41|nr:glycine betaine ABC transporter substrate-binding protein [Duganella sp. 1224]NYE62265.1 glycine betaine/proline transport system substrate-binding protein [Duganella sp. 1224]
MKPLIKLGHIDLSFHAASAAVVESLLNLHGHEVHILKAPHEKMFEMLGRGEVDVMASAWLPASHEKYLAPIRDQVRELTVLYEPYCIWGVPDYVPAEVLASVDDLRKPEVLGRMQRRIQGINPGAGISRFSAAMVEAYGLAELGYRFQSGTEQDCFGAYERAVAAREWVIIPLWHPQFLHARYRIRALHEPKGLLGGQDAATLVMRRDAQDKLDPATIRALEGLYLGNDVVTAIDSAMLAGGRSSSAA